MMSNLHLPFKNCLLFLQLRVASNFQTMSSSGGMYQQCGAIARHHQGLRA